jgi:hypothetical protein
MIEPTGAGLMLLGLILIIIRKPFSRFVIEGQNSFWGVHFGKAELRQSILAMWLMGILLIALGAIVGFKIIE